MECFHFLSSITWEIDRSYPGGKHPRARIYIYIYKFKRRFCRRYIFGASLSHCTLAHHRSISRFLSQGITYIRNRLNFVRRWTWLSLTSTTHRLAAFLPQFVLDHVVHRYVCVSGSFHSAVAVLSHLCNRKVGKEKEKETCCEISGLVKTPIHIIVRSHPQPHSDSHTDRAPKWLMFQWHFKEAAALHESWSVHVSS
jgi:hypothetical protein